jgi:hypothetical protein
MANPNSYLKMGNFQGMVLFFFICLNMMCNENRQLLIPDDPFRKAFI